MVSSLHQLALAGYEYHFEAILLNRNRCKNFHIISCSQLQYFSYVHLCYTYPGFKHSESRQYICYS